MVAARIAFETKIADTAVKGGYKFAAKHAELVGLDLEALRKSGRLSILSPACSMTTPV